MEKNIYNLKLHEELEIQKGQLNFIQRVPGGWNYVYKFGVQFVAFHDEFKEKPKQQELIPAEKFNFKKSLVELGAEKQIVSDYMEHRTKKKLSNTKTAFNTLRNQLLLAKSKNNSIDKCLTSIIDGGWQKFKAEWMDNENKKIEPNEQGSKIAWK